MKLNHWKGSESGRGKSARKHAGEKDGTLQCWGSALKIALRSRHRKSAVPEMPDLGKFYQNGFSTTIATMRIISTAGTSFMIRQ